MRIIEKKKHVLLEYTSYCTISNGLAGGVTWDRVDEFRELAMVECNFNSCLSIGCNDQYSSHVVLAREDQVLHLLDTSPYIK